MRLESLPIVLGVVLGVLGLALLLDASSPDDIIGRQERRQRPRRERDRPGEALVGLGTLAMAFTFFAAEAWRYSIVGVVAGALLLLWGVKRNGGYLQGVLSRGKQSPRGAVRPKYEIKRKFADGPRRLR